MDKQPGTDEVAAVHGWRENRIAELERERDALRTALERAREDMESWAAYADEYFREKHDLAGDLAAIDKALEKSNGQ
jgi:chromosome segregation ATPase